MFPSHVYRTFGQQHEEAEKSHLRSSDDAYGLSNSRSDSTVLPIVSNNNEKFELVTRLQSALFGGVFLARNQRTGLECAVKVVEKAEIQRLQGGMSGRLDFCEVALNEIRFAGHMRGHRNVLPLSSICEDPRNHYLFFPLARGGDLLEMLKRRPDGFDEPTARFLMRQALAGLAFLHERRLAMQDISLENLLLCVDGPSGHFAVKLCDPGQAVQFAVDAQGHELAVPFRGLIGKSFRPPELYSQLPYLASRVDSWCVGWSLFYLLTAQCLFHTADPVERDSDWLAFLRSSAHATDRVQAFASLVARKGASLSPSAADLVLTLLRLEPGRRGAVAHIAQTHEWFRGESPPMSAPMKLITAQERSSAVETNENAPPRNQEVLTVAPPPPRRAVGKARAAPPPPSAPSPRIAPRVLRPTSPAPRAQSPRRLAQPVLGSPPSRLRAVLLPSATANARWPECGQRSPRAAALSPRLKGLVSPRLQTRI